jgi:tricorn protease interacting factor F2/3
MKIASYDLQFNFQKSSDYINGKEKISAHLIGEKIELDAVDTNIKSILINGEAQKFSMDSKKGLVIIDGDFNGPCDIDIEFVSKVTDALRAMYRVRLGDHEFLTTDFEPTGARRLFPCVDRPQYKAEFRVSVLVDNDLDAISNMPVRGTTSVSGRKRIEFESTPPMSTYLFYLGIGNFDHITGKLDKKDVTLIAPKGSLYSTDFPVKSAIASLKFYEDYFSIPYQLPKLHLISVPDYAAGAMENWGAITFRERYIQATKDTSAATLSAIDEVVAHELAHQWFGDLVTMKWWNDLWLNESFATFMAYKTVNSLHPEYEILNNLIDSEKRGALLGDSLSSTHPIDVNVVDPEEISQIFDEISYGKGGNILRMLENYLGEDNFRSGIRSYLKKYSYKNAAGTDLWTELEEVTGKPVSGIMKAWITKKGYPAITATLDGSKIRLSQEKFTLLGKADDEIWPIPLIVWREHSKEAVLFDKREMEIPSKEFVKLDSGSTGFYRVQYDNTIMENIMKHVSLFGVLDRWGILNDIFALFMSGRKGFQDYLTVLDTMSNDKDPLIMSSIASDLYSLYTIDPTNAFLKGRLRAYLQKFNKTLGDPAKEEKHSVTVTRGSIRAMLVQLDPEYAKKLSGNFSSYDTFDPNLKRSLAIATALTTNSATTIIDKIKVTKKDDARQHLIYALGFTSGEKNYAALKKSIENETIPRQDSFSAFFAATILPENRKIVFDDYSSIMATLEKIFTGSGYLPRFIEMTAPVLGIDREEEMKRELFSVNYPDASMGVKKALEYLDIMSRVKASMHS